MQNEWVRSKCFSSIEYLSEWAASIKKVIFSDEPWKKSFFCLWNKHLALVGSI